jgi:group I intron endonuclease
MLYVALTRTSKQEFVNFCDIALFKPYVGYIYRFVYNGRSYIGSTIDIKARKEEHITNTTNKFGRAIQKYGYKQFKFEILETLQFGERTELYDVENQYIIKYDSINNGFNTRRNYKVDV